MAYAAVVTVQDLPDDRWLIRIEEEDAGTSDTKEIDLSDPIGDQSVEGTAFSEFELVQVETMIVSGTGTEVTPELSRYLDDGSTTRMMFQAPEAVDHMVWTFLAPPAIRTGKLLHQANPDSGSDNVIWTEYILRKVA